MFTVSHNPVLQQSLRELQKQLNPAMAELNKFLERQVQDFEPPIRILVDRCLLNRGKKIRPSLVFLAGMHDEERTLQKLVRAAAVVEIVPHRHPGA